MEYDAENGVRAMGEALRITGGNKLFGSVAMPGAKNSALPMMAAALLCDGEVTLEHIPHLRDVETSRQILHDLGCQALRQGDAMVIRAGTILRSSVPPHLMCAMRSSVFYLAPLLVRTGRAIISSPGGCNLGARPIDLHLNGLCAMGAQIQENGREAQVTAPKTGLHGADITLRFPSVGATETLLMAAACAQGETILRGAAQEPEIVDLAAFLQSAGVRISGAGTRVVRVVGQELLLGARHAVCPDRITAATVLCAVAGCGGEVLLTNTCNAHLEPVLHALCQASCHVSARGQHSLVLASDGVLTGVGALCADVFPALPTDAAPLLAAALLRAKGESVLTDRVFENRFACAEGFRALGAQAAVQQRTLTLQGVPVLRGARLQAADLRGGAALVLAALQAQGESVVSGVAHIDRGYEDLAALLTSLGAGVIRTEE
jgi:UDP-N-acetylglucosamine 1-carboxyvinyltransferase